MYLASGLFEGASPAVLINDEVNEAYVRLLPAASRPKITKGAHSDAFVNSAIATL